MNTFGRFFRINIFGESHGHCVGILVDGVPAGIKLCINDFVKDISRRNPKIVGTTERKEADLPYIVSGVFNGYTTAAPILILFENQKQKERDYDFLKDIPRPGHADFTTKVKYGSFNDYRGAGHFSGRMTVGLVAAGVIAKKIINNIKIKAEIVEVGGSKRIKDEVQKAIKNNDSIGGIIECRINKLPVGLGEPFFDSIESLISHLVFSIPGIKGIEFGVGFGVSSMNGSEYNDILLNVAGKTKTNNSGGINGGISNGNELIFKVAVRPSASISKEQQTVNLRTGKNEKISVLGRHDACFALRIPVIVEAVSAIVIADLMCLEQKIKRIKR